MTLCANQTQYQSRLRVGWVAGVIFWFVVKGIIPFSCQDLE